MSNVNIYFSDFFNVEEKVIDEYGAINISLINELPLFVDPFLLFSSEDKKLKKIHDEMISYLKFLQIKSEQIDELSGGMLKSWFMFSEVKQTWLGFSLSGNAGRGLGLDFAKGLFNGFKTVFKSFSKEAILQEAHMEKLCLISDKVGKDKISDFTTNFCKQYLLEYTERFAKRFLSPDQCQYFNVDKVSFDYKTERWNPHTYFLPSFNGDYVLLTPKSILTRDDTFINKSDMVSNIQLLASSIEDEALRFQLNNYFELLFSDSDKKITKSDKDEATEIFIRTHPEIIDYYLKYKEEHKSEAESASKEHVDEVNQLLITQMKQLSDKLEKATDFYNTIPNAHEETRKRIEYFKHVIEDQEGYKLFYVNDKPVRSESDLQVLYRLVWFGTKLDVNREVNNGRGPVDYKSSFGKGNATLVEFKLASNSKLKQNLNHQVDIYKAASETSNAFKVILFFSESELNKVEKVLSELNLTNDSDIILIDARKDNKISASNVK